MRVTDIYYAGYGPFAGHEVRHLDVNDERVLFLGISGSGKSTLFLAVQMLWEQLERYLAHEDPLYMGRGNLAMVFDEMPFGQGVICWGSKAFCKKVTANHPQAKHLGTDGETFWGNWPDESYDYANIATADEPLDWKSLLIFSPEAMEAANQLLVGKHLENCCGSLQVCLDNTIRHSADQLSMGEKRICHLCALAGAALKPGGLLLLDEPDVHLHPSQCLGVMTTLENLVLDKGGQMWVISHKETLWQRYEDVGQVVVLTREEAHHA